MDAPPSAVVHTFDDWPVVRRHKGFVRWREIEEFLIEVPGCNLRIAGDGLKPSLVENVVFRRLINGNKPRAAKSSNLREGPPCSFLDRRRLASDASAYSPSKAAIVSKKVDFPLAPVP